MPKQMTVWAALVASTITIAGHAQQPNATWTELQRGDLSVPGREGAAGDAYLIRRGRVHHARNIGRTPARFLDTYVIEKGQPVVTPAPPR